MWSFRTADGYQSLFSICLVSSKNKKNCGIVTQRKLAACMTTQPVPEDTFLKKITFTTQYIKANSNVEGWGEVIRTIPVRKGKCHLNNLFYFLV